MSEYVVGDQQVRLAALGNEAGRELPAEELDHGLDPPFPGRLRDVGRGLDPQRGYAALDDVLEQVAVVAGQLDHLAVLPQPEALDHGGHVVARVGDPGIRIGREVCVLGEDRLRRHQLLELYEQALLADPHVQRIEGLHRPQLLQGDVALAQRRHAEVDERVAQGRRAETTAGQARGRRRRIDLISEFDWHRPLSVHQRRTGRDSPAASDARSQRFQLRRNWSSCATPGVDRARCPSGRPWPNINYSWIPVPRRRTNAPRRTRAILRAPFLLFATFAPAGSPPASRWPTWRYRRRSPRASCGQRPIVETRFTAEPLRSPTSPRRASRS